MTRHQVDGVHLNTRRFGPPAAPDLIALHGFTGSSATWEPLAAALPDRTIVAVDLLGHGDSDCPSDPSRYRVERAVEDLQALLVRLCPRPPVVLGYSMGGRVALRLALDVPARLDGLIVESASPGIADPDERAARTRSDAALADFAEREGIAAFVDRWERIPLFASQERLPAHVRDRLRADRLRRDSRGLANSLRGLGAGEAAPLHDRLAELAVPTLAIAGGRDAKYADLARELARRSPRVVVRIVPDAGHAVHLEAPDAFAALVGTFLEERRATSVG